MITQSITIVYKGGRRRYFSLDSACHAEARMKINKRCNCEHGDISDGFSFEPCKYHADEKRLEKMMRRLVFKYKLTFKLSHD